MFTEKRAIWIYDQYNWIDRCVPRRIGAAGTALVTPTSEFFPEKYTKTHESAELIFNRIRALVGASDWDCVLLQSGGEEVELQKALGNAGVLGSLRTGGGAAGTFSKRERVTITYAPHLLADPLVLVATLAHEMSHYLLACASEAPACAKEDLEPLTDLVTVAAGFGLFSCHAAFQFKQWTGTFTQGWSVRRLGYMSEAEFAFGVGIFCIRNGVPLKHAAKYLRPNPRQVFNDSLDFIHDLDRMRASNQTQGPAPS